MSKVSNIFLYYCAAVAVFITVSGFIASKTVEGYAFQLIFLPITLYFIFAVLRNLAAWVKKAETGPTLDVTLSGKRTTLIAFFLIFLALLALGVSNIFFRDGKQIEQNVPSTAIQNADNSDKANSSQTLTVIAESPSALVNIRQKPDTSSPIVGRATVGQEFSFTQLSGEWYEIVLENGQKGYIHKDFAETGEK